MAATTYPLLFTIFGFYGFVDLSSWDAHRGATTIVSSNLYSLASLAIVLASAIAVEYFFGTSHPRKELEREIQKRLTVLSGLFHAIAKQDLLAEPARIRSLQNAVVQYAHAGDRHLNKLYNLIRDASANASAMPIGIPLSHRSPHSRH
jgi:multidrug resistance protein MdtO